MQAFGEEGTGASGDSSQDVSFARRSSDCSSSRVTLPTPKTDTFGLGYDPAASMGSERGGGAGGDVLALRLSRERHRAAGPLVTAGAYHTSDLLGGAGTGSSRRGAALYLCVSACLCRCAK